MNSEEQAVEGDIAGTDYIEYPRYKVVSVFSDSSKVMSAVGDLAASGFSAESIEAFCGWTGEDAKVFEGTSPGVWEQFIHAAKHLGPERTYIERYERHLKAGDCIVMVKVENNEQKSRAAEILHSYTDERVTYFGLLAADEVK